MVSNRSLAAWATSSRRAASTKLDNVIRYWLAPLPLASSAIWRIWSARSLSGALGGGVAAVGRVVRLPGDGGGDGCLRDRCGRVELDRQVGVGQLGGDG